MPFVHSLVKATVKGKKGWCAPAELGEAAPHYVSFVVPLTSAGEFFHEYTCEIVRTLEQGSKTIEAYELLPQGRDCFLLSIDDVEFWFTLRTVPKGDRRLPYVGKLRHPDFAFLFTEIEPEDQKRLDKLYDDDNIFVIGCEPFTHYLGIKPLLNRR
jgi:hypothetical protein